MPLTLQRSLLACLALACHVTTVWPAERNDSFSAQERLEAVKVSLIEEAMKTPSTVQAYSWINSKGELHELGLFKNRLDFDRVQSKNYEREPSGKVKADLEIQSSSPKTVSEFIDFLDSDDEPSNQAVAARCTPNSANARFRHPIRLVFEPDVRIEPVISKALHAALKQEWLDALPEEQPWVMWADLRGPLLSNQMTTYERTLLGQEPGVLPWKLVLQASTRRVEAPDPLSWPTTQPWVELTLKLQLIPMDRHQTVQDWRNIKRMTIEMANFKPAVLDEWSQGRIQRQLMAWKQQLDAWLMCETVRPRVTRNPSSGLTLHAGDSSGVQVGDEWLITDQSNWQGLWTKEEAVQRMSLAKVISVGQSTAKLIIIAGPDASPGMNLRAWPAEQLLAGQTDVKSRKSTSLGSAKSQKREVLR